MLRACPSSPAPPQQQTPVAHASGSFSNLNDHVGAREYMGRKRQEEEGGKRKKGDTNVPSFSVHLPQPAVSSLNKGARTKYLEPHKQKASIVNNFLPKLERTVDFPKKEEKKANPLQSVSPFPVSVQIFFQLFSTNILVPAHIPSMLLSRRV